MVLLLTLLDLVLNIVTLGAWGRAQGNKTSGREVRSYPKYDPHTNSWK